MEVAICDIQSRGDGLAETPIRIHGTRRAHALQRAQQQDRHCRQHPDHPRLHPHARIAPHHKDLLLELEKLRNTSKEHGGKIQVIFRYLKQMEKRETERVLLAEVAKTKPRRALGFKVGKAATSKTVGRKR